MDNVSGRFQLFLIVLMIISIKLSKYSSALSYSIVSMVMQFVFESDVILKSEVFLRLVYEIRDLSWNIRDLSFTWNWSVTVTDDALCLMYVCKSFDKS